MRVLSATIGALLISVSHAALAQEQNVPQGEAAQAESRCDPRLGYLPQLQSVGMTAEELVAQLPEARLGEQSETRPAEMTAEELVAQLPEARPGEQSETRPAEMTAEELVAQLPEARPGEQSETRPAEMTAEELVAQLPEARPGEQSETRPAEMTAEELVAQLPARPADMKEEEKRQPEAMKAEMQQDRSAQTEMPQDPQWVSVTEAKSGTTVDIPRAVLSTPDGHAHKRVGRRYKTPDGRAKVAIWTQRNTRHDTPAGYLHRTFNIPRSTVDYERFTADFAVISGIFGTRIYYIRCNYSRRSGSFHCFDLAYPVREKRTWDAVVTRMSRSLRAHYE